MALVFKGLSGINTSVDCDIRMIGRGECLGWRVRLDASKQATCAHARTDACVNESTGSDQERTASGELQWRDHA
jgi:hypothetical protein